MPAIDIVCCFARPLLASSTMPKAVTRAGTVRLLYALEHKEGMENNRPL